MVSLKPKSLLPPFDEDEEFCDDEEIQPLETMFPNSGSSGNELPGWDAFINKPESSGSTSELTEQFMATGVKILKITVYVLTCAIVLASTVISKGVVLLMTSQLQINKTISVCNKDYDLNKQYIANITPEENTAWAWYLFFLYSVPELGTLLRSIRKKLFKIVHTSSFLDFLVVLFFETLHTIGIGLFMYAVLPNINVVKGAMLTSCAAFVPGCIALLTRNATEKGYGIKLILDCASIFFQFTGLLIWPIMKIFEDDQDSPGQFFLITLSLFLISFGWWENYVKVTTPFLGNIKQRLVDTRYFIYMFIPIFKLLIMFTVMVVTMGVQFDNFGQIFEMEEAFTNHTMPVTELRSSMPVTSITNVNEVMPMGEIHYYNLDYLTPLYVFLTGVLTSYCAYIFGKFACKIHMQSFSFAFPITLSVPVLIASLVTISGYRYEDVCKGFDDDFMPKYLFWRYDEGKMLDDFIIKDFAWFWFFWLISQTWITSHIWTNNNERLASTEKLFITPMYSSIIVDQSMAMNRARHVEVIKYEDLENENNMDSENVILNGYENKVFSSDNITRIYACATMWHETAEEMKEMLKSILKVDQDQSSRRIAQNYLGIIDQDFYEFETHIMFDDAFEISDHNDNEHVVNKFVRDMVESIEIAACYVHRTNIRIRPPKKIPTPYGGRLVWTLPGKTKIYCHLKDKDKIRHKKRWSQCMYMYYILGFKLMDTPISVERKAVLAENTYILALDGDIDFAPKAVRLLVDLMKKNRNLGAACGRIHPVGSGLLVWYQMFEYAVGHWMQKATEHVIGCVLCSPGCFSLFRGSALMDENVMAKYTTKSSQARHYVQFDQGEDRWLCTLILQRGYRVEYCAASDSYTNAPEKFDEFYNQRRRWTPSTMANIMDLLSNYKGIVKRNENISKLYIFYQTFVLFGTILGPGTIFLMLVGSFSTAFPGLVSNTTAFIINFVPIVLYCIGCIVLKSQNQIRFAYLLSAAYALLMIIVLVGMFVTFATEGWNSPTAIFFLFTACSFIVTGILHPQEIACLPAGIIYYLLIPSMYLLLQIYSCYNLNNVSWGTREVATKKTKKEQELERQAAEAAAAANKKNKNDNSLLGFLYKDKSDNDEGSMEFSLAGLFKCMCCVHKKPDDKLQVVQALEAIQNKLDSMDNNAGGGGSSLGARRRSSIRSRRSDPYETVPDDLEEDEEEITEPQEERNMLINPYWIEDKDLKRGEVDYLSSTEITFWKELIEKYLYPLNKNKAEQESVTKALDDLRNMVVFTFTMLNAIFVIAIFMLQINQDKIYLKWVWGVKTQVNYIPNGNDKVVYIIKDYLKLEPIGIVFLACFGLLMIIQFGAMLFHRFGTFSHILSTTDLRFKKSSAEDLDSETNLQEFGIKFVKEMTRLSIVNEDTEDKAPVKETGPNRNTARRMTVMNIEKNRTREPAISSLDAAFRKRLQSISDPDAGYRRDSIFTNIRDVNKRRDTINNILERGQSVSVRRPSIRRNSRRPSMSSYESQESSNPKA